MNYLGLAQDTHRIIAAGDERPGSVPTDMTATNDGLESDIAGWINDAYEEIVMDQDDWLFMKNKLDIKLTPGSGDWPTIAVAQSNVPFNSGPSISTDALDPYYGLVVPYSTLKRDTSTPPAVGLFDNYSRVEPLLNPHGQRYMLVGTYDDAGLPVQGYTTCYYVDPQDFHGFFDAQQHRGSPIYFTQTDDGGISLSAVPTRTTRLRCDYRFDFSPMVNDTSEPVFPARYHKAIVYRAAAMYCEQRPDPERFVQFQRRYLDIMDSMRGEQLPEFKFDVGQMYR